MHLSRCSWGLPGFMNNCTIGQKGWKALLIMYGLTQHMWQNNINLATMMFATNFSLGFSLHGLRDDIRDKKENVSACNTGSGSVYRLLRQRPSEHRCMSSKMIGQLPWLV